MDYGCGSVGSPGVNNTVLAKLDMAGVCLWSAALPAGTWFSLDPMENVLLATTFTGTIDFGGGPLTSAGTSDLAIAKLDATGAFVWGESFGAIGAGVSGMTSIGATSTGGIALAAGLDGAVDFGCGAVSGSTGATTLFASFDASGLVISSSVVQASPSAWTAGPIVDGLGGLSAAVVLPNVSTGPPVGPPVAGTSDGVLVSRFVP